MQAQGKAGAARRENHRRIAVSGDDDVSQSSRARYADILQRYTPSVVEKRALEEIASRSRLEVIKALGQKQRYPSPFRPNHVPLRTAPKLGLVPPAPVYVAPPIDYSPEAIEERRSEYWECFMGPRMGLEVRDHLKGGGQ